MASQTPERRSTRERRTTRLSSPLTARGSRTSGVSNVESPQDRQEAANDAAEKQAITGTLAKSENAATHNANSDITPSTRPKISLKFSRNPNKVEAPTESTPQTDSRARKSGRVSGAARRNTQTSSSPGYEEEMAVDLPVQAEPSEDDDYTPTGKQVKARRARKSLGAVNNDSRSNTPPDQERPNSGRTPELVHYETVVSAIDVARKQGNDILGLALKLIYIESRTDPHLYDLFSKTLVNKSTLAEREEFQARVKLCKRQAKRILEEGVTASTFEVDFPPGIYEPISASKRQSPAKAPAQKTQSGATSTKPAPKLLKKVLTKKVTPEIPPVSPQPAARGRTTRRAAASPVPASSQKTPVPRIETPQREETLMATRNSKKRPSATPEPSSRADVGAINGESERPRKRVRISPEVQEVATPNESSEEDELLSDLSSPSPPPSMLHGDSFTDNRSSVHGYNKGGQQLKRKPDNSQKVKVGAATKHGIGLPDDEMIATKQRLAQAFNHYGPNSMYSDFRPEHRPSRRIRDQPSTDVDGVFTPEARAQIDRTGAQSPATSSINGDLLIPPPEGYGRPISRTSTPGPAGRNGRTQKRQSRIKHSPAKKKNPISGGPASLAAAGARNSPVDVQADGESDNIDYCVSCGDSGQLVCCDGCPRAFHSICCDPPFDVKDNPPPENEPWFCAVCTSKREAQPKPPRSLFASLLHDVRRYNATKFALPVEIQTYYEGVHANEEGTYVQDDGTRDKPRTRATGSAADPDADSHKVKDSKGNLIFCYKCSESAAGRREVIKCDYCPQYWHLDCLDPPPANPPVKAGADGRRPLWKCPAHATADSNRYGERRVSHKIRRPKNAKLVDTLLNRGLKNNGNIEIENEPSDDEDMRDARTEDGIVYRVTEGSIKLDFLERVQRLADVQRAEDRRREEEAQRERGKLLQAERDFNRRSILEQRAVLNMIQFQQQNALLNGPSINELGSAGQLEEDKLRILAHELIREASPEVLALIEDSAPNQQACVNGIQPSTGGNNNNINSSSTGGRNSGLDQLQVRDIIMFRDLANRLLERLAEQREHANLTPNGLV